MKNLYILPAPHTPGEGITPSDRSAAFVDLSMQAAAFMLWDNQDEGDLPPDKLLIHPAAIDQYVARGHLKIVGGVVYYCDEDVPGVVA